MEVVAVSDADARGIKIYGTTPEGRTAREVHMRDRDSLATVPYSRLSVHMRFYEYGRLVREVGGELSPWFCTRYACDWIREDRQ